MHRVTAAVVSSVVALLGFGVAFAIAFFVGLSTTGSWECDGPCFEQWDEVLWVALGIGALCGVIIGVAGWRRLTRSSRHEST